MSLLLVEVIAVVGVEADLAVEADLVGVELLGAFGALATRLATFFSALACVACLKLRAIIQKFPCVQEGCVEDLEFPELSIYRIEFSL